MLRLIKFATLGFVCNYNEQKNLSEDLDKDYSENDEDDFQYDYAEEDLAINGINDEDEESLQ